MECALAIGQPPSRRRRPDGRRAVASKASRPSTSSRRRLEGVPTVDEQPPSRRRHPGGRHRAAPHICWGLAFAGAGPRRCRRPAAREVSRGRRASPWLTFWRPRRARARQAAPAFWILGSEAPRRSLGGREACLEGSLRRARASSRLTTCRLSPCGVLQLPSIQSLPSLDCPARASRVPARSSCVLRWFRLPSCTSRPADLRASTGPPCCSWDKLPRPSDALQAAPHE